ncbi:MAG: D-aminoacylase [SAR324 cluster bacterium]|nr:D-aminoacylase [SAR324 cluster bacterium]
MSDLLIRGGWIVDGSGAPGFQGDVVIAEGRIEAVYREGQASVATGGKSLDAGGLTVAPGFIDVHTHSELALVADPTSPFKIAQGVTTEILGNCGFSAAPLRPTTAALQQEVSAGVFGHAGLDWNWETLTGYFGRLEADGTAVNTATLVGHGALRNAVMGFEARDPTPEEMEAMRLLLAECMEAGALGLSTGLVYPPGCYAQTPELKELAKVVGRYGGIYATHLRNQSAGLLDAVAEALEIGDAGNIPVQISHHKCSGAANRGLVRESLALLDGARSGGVRPGSDMYPYLAGSSTLVSLFPPWSLEGGVRTLLARLRDDAQRTRIEKEFSVGVAGWENRIGVVGWENIFVSSVSRPENGGWIGRNLQDIAASRGQPPQSTICHVVLAEEGRVGYIGYNSSEEDLEIMMHHPRTSFGSDGLDVGERPHPRLYGTFPRVLGEYVRRRGVLTLEEAVHKMTALPASQTRLEGVGRIQPGYRADLVLFDAEHVDERSTFEDPRRYPEGLPHVFVGGTAVVKDGHITGALPGKVLRRGRSTA